MIRRVLRSFTNIQKGDDGQEYSYTQVPMDQHHPHYTPHQDYYWSTKDELSPHPLEIRTDVDWESTLNHWHRKFWAADILKMVWMMGMHSFETEVTINYPAEKGPLSPLFRGEHGLRRYPTGEERCIACKLCEAACPPRAIKIEAEPRPDNARKTIRYDIDMTKCIYCGYCQEACPVDAIVLSSNFEFSTLAHSDMLYTKTKLIDNGDRWEAQLARNLEWITKRQ
ncbi:unnamed protein product [Blepharisma stoltei]|uniref:4Fe-4S ferredoxin-type domain-containing protein n=1 Tax=Blepharisma stoltei TaxID=1481888 RepID=A0AAU9JWE4_9CILI|nr:unnamed protein product [Blepharisma stoltei]